MASILLYPNGAGSETNLTGQYPNSTYHYDKVDEVTADDFSTYVTCVSSTYLRDLYAFPASGIPAGAAITSVIVYFRIRQEPYAFSQGKAKPSIKSGVTVYDGTEVLTGDVQGAWTNHSQTFTLNPVTSAAWTIAEIDAAEFGISLNSLGYSMLCTQLYIKVNYYIVGTADAITRDTSVARYYNRKARMLRMSVGLGGLATIPMLASEGFKPTPTVGETGSTPSLDMIQKTFDVFNDFFTFPGKMPGIVTPQAPYTPYNPDGEKGISVPAAIYHNPADAEQVYTPPVGLPPSDAEVGLSVPDSIYHNPADAEHVAAPKLPSLPPLPGFNPSDGESTGNNTGNSGAPLNGGRGGYLWDF